MFISTIAGQFSLQSRVWQRLLVGALPAILAATVVFIAGCGGSSDTRLETRASISGLVVLAEIAGLDDLSRVSVDIGRGEGGVAVDESGGFSFSDLEPDVYALTITYAGGLTSEASDSAYQPYAIEVIAEEGGSVNLGEIDLRLGVGTVIGDVTLVGGGNTDGAEVELKGALLLRKTAVTSGSFRFDDVPVGNYVLSVDLAGAAVASSQSACGASVTVGYHGEAATGESLYLDSTNVALSPGAGETMDTSGDVWLLNGNTVTLVAQAGFAVHGRAWLEGASVPDYAAHLTAGYPLSGLSEGATQAHAQFRDLCGFESDVFSVDLILDQTAPDIEFVRLKGGDAYTTEPAVSLTVGASDALSESLEMKVAICDVDASGVFTCDPTLAAAPWRPYAFAQTVTFTDTQGTKGVLVLVRDRSGNEITTAEEQTVVYDSLAPQNVTITMGDGSGTITEASPLVTIAADGASWMKVGTVAGLGNVDWGVFQGAFRHTFSPDDGTKTLYVRLKDNAGNETGELSVQAVLTTTGTLSGVAKLILRAGQEAASHLAISVDLLGPDYSDSTQTTDTGTWVLTGVPAGFYDLVFAKDGYGEETIFDIYIAANDERVVPEVDLVAQFASIVGTVELQGKSSYAGVRIYMPNTPYEYFTDVGGGFSLEVEEATYNDGVCAQKDRFSEVCFTDPVVALNEQAFDIGLLTLLATHNDIRGRVSLYGRTDHSNVEVTAVNEAGVGNPVVTLTDTTGNFNIEELPLGSYRVTMEYLGDIGWEEPGLGGVAVAAGDPTDLGVVPLRQRFITIDDAEGDGRTNDPNVTLTLGAADCLTMQISNDDTIFTDSVPTPLSCVDPAERANVPWVLATGDGTKTVYARFTSSSAPTTWTDIVDDSTELDETIGIVSVTHDGPTPPAKLGLGDTVHFTLTALGNETGGTATISLGAYATGIPLYEGAAGVYETDYTILLVGDTPDIGAVVTGNFEDSFGNLDTANAATNLRIGVPPLITNIVIDTNSQDGTAVISWETDEDTTGTVDYCTQAEWDVTPVYTLSEPSGASGTVHSVSFAAGVLVLGTTYHFSITATDLSDNDASTTDRTFLVLPNKPSFVAAIPGIGRVHVRWEAPDQDGLTYTVYRSETAGSGYTALVTGYTHEALVYEDTTVTNGTTYYYVVTATDPSANESVYSDEHSATPLAVGTGPTSVQGALQGTNVWSELGSPYIVTGTVAVEADSLLVIGPKTEVRVQKPATGTGHRFLVHGRFAAIGDRGVPDGMGGESDDGLIRFTSDEAAPATYDWRGIHFEQESPHGRLDLQDGRYFSGNLFYRVSMSYAETALTTVAVNNYPLTLAVLRSFLTQNGGGIQWATISTQSGLLVADSVISDNNGFACSSACASLLIRVSVINNVGGTGSIVYSISYEIDATIVDSLISDNTPTGYVGSSCGNGAVLVMSGGGKLEIIDSTISGNGVSGIFLCGGAGHMTLANSTITDNVGFGVFSTVLYYSHPRTVVNIYGTSFSGNQAAIGGATRATEAIGCDFFGEAAADHSVVHSLEDLNLLKWNRFTGSISHNSCVFVPTGSLITNNSFEVTLVDQATLMSTTSPYTEPDIDAAGNYWGAGGTAEILAGGNPKNLSVIDDYWDNPNLAHVLYDNWAVSALPLARITSPRWGYEYRVGDEITFEGFADDPEDGPLSGTSLEWRDDSDNLLGTGDTLVTSTLTAGTQRIWLYGIDSDGQEGAVPTEVVIVQ